jgi:hypothetical protein
LRGAKGATGARGPKGARGATGAQGPAGISNASSSSGPTNQDVASTDPANPTAMATLTLSPGNYVIMANGWAQGSASGQATIHCGIDTGTGDQGVGESLSGPAEGSVATTLAVSLTATTTYRFNCYRVTAADMHLLRAQLTALRVGSITNQ